MNLLRVSTAALLVTLAVPVLSGRPAHDVAAETLVPAAAIGALPSDFNGDGVEDRAIGVPRDKKHTGKAGSIHVVYGQGSGGTAPSDQYFTLSSPFLERLIKAYPSGMASQIASGDFDRDGYADLAMNVPGFDEPDLADPRINVGGVVVVYGTAHGLDPHAAQAPQLWSQDSPGVQGVSEDGDAFGSALAVGDFDGDRYLDLAVGIEGEQTGPGASESGAVTILYGGRAGLTSRDQEVDQDTRGILDSSEAGDVAGDALAADDFNGDSVDDLAVGVRGEDVSGQPNAGAVNVIYGTRDVGLTGRGDRFVHQGLDSIPGVAAADAGFGAALTVGDFNGDHFEDLVVGAPHDTIDGAADQGSATLIPGSSTGLALMRSSSYTLRDLGGSANRPELGSVLASGDVDGDGYDELAIGSANPAASARVDVLAGSADGPSPVAAQVLTSDQLDQTSLGGATPWYPTALQLGEFDPSPGADLLVGLAGATVVVDGTERRAAGVVEEVPSRSGRLDPAASRLLREGIPGVRGTPQHTEYFGTALPGSANPSG